MSKITVDVDYVRECLRKIGYIVSDCVERDNNGKNWQIKFSNSGAIVTIYDTNSKKNTVVNGKLESEEGEKLKEIVDKLKCKELLIDPLNEEIVRLINNKQESDFYDYKSQGVYLKRTEKV